MPDIGCTFWNPWHGCTKISPGCRHCYVYRQDRSRGLAESSLCRRTQAFRLPIQERRDGNPKLAPGTLVYTCFSSDFLLEDADIWRDECWNMIRERRDCRFLFFTKRIHRLRECLPEDWGDGWDHVKIGCTVENQDRADYRLPIFLELPIRHRSVIAEPMLERIDLRPWLGPCIEEVTAGGESGPEARELDYSWILDLRQQCMEKGVSFHFHQTGANFRKDGRLYRIERQYQQSQARKAGIDYRTGRCQICESEALP